MPEDPTLKDALSSATFRPLLKTWAERVFVADQFGFLFDFYAKRPTEYLYTQYIAEGAPDMLNLDRVSDMKPLWALHKKGEAGKADLDKAMSDTFDKMLVFLAGTYTNNKQGFLIGEEYQAYVNSKRAPAVGTVLGALKLAPAKNTQMEPLLKMYFTARTAPDAKAAYDAMVKIVAKPKLDPALAAADKPITEVEKAAAAEAERLLAVKNAALAAKYLPAIKTELAAVKSYFSSALPTVKAKGRPGNPIEVTRMFNSGRTRMEKLTTAYTKAVKLDKAFATKNSAIAAEKKKMDEQWAEYRKLLGK